MSEYGGARPMDANERAESKAIQLARVKAERLNAHAQIAAVLAGAGLAAHPDVQRWLAVLAERPAPASASTKFQSDLANRVARRDNTQFDIETNRSVPTRGDQERALAKAWENYYRPGMGQDDDGNHTGEVAAFKAGFAAGWRR